ncbi:MAG: hypothetical protein ACKVQW_14470 [Pyrinomonadaceae bacterium]
MFSSFEKRRFTRKSWIVILILSMNISFAGQTKQDERSMEIPPPSKEQFSSTSGVIAPWRDSGCMQPTAMSDGLPGCYWVKADDYRKMTEMQIFAGDGSIWYAFSLDLDSPRYWWKDSRRLLVPFSTLHPIDYPYTVILLLVSESENWYEVEINNGTGEKKYIYKKDLHWKKTTWDHWLTSFNFYLQEDHAALLDAPNGKPIPKSAELRFDRVQFIKRDGDWAYVRGLILTDGRVIPPEYGWLQWKKGKQLLVGCIFNGQKVP